MVCARQLQSKEISRICLDIGVKDVLIASICLENDLPILTTNEQHFSRVQGLKVIAPAQFINI